MLAVFESARDNYFFQQISTLQQPYLRVNVFFRQRGSHLLQGSSLFRGQWWIDALAMHQNAGLGLVLRRKQNYGQDRTQHDRCKGVANRPPAAKRYKDQVARGEDAGLNLPTIANDEFISSHKPLPSNR